MTTVQNSTHHYWLFLTMNDTIFFHSLVVNLSPTTTVNNEQHRCKNREWFLFERPRLRCIFKENSQKAWCQTKVGGSMWWSGFEWAADLPLFSSQSKHFKFPLPLSHIKSLPMILSLPWISILGIERKARNLKGLLFSINHQLDEK